MAGVAQESSSGSANRSSSGVEAVGVAQHTVQILKLLWCHRVAPVDDLGGPRVGRPRLGLLGVGHGHHPEGEDLVDLGGVEERTGALGGELGMVLDDDRRHEQDRRLVGRSGEDRPPPLAVGSRPQPHGPVRRVDRRDELAAPRRCRSRCAPMKDTAIASALSACGGAVFDIASERRRKPSTSVGCELEVGRQLATLAHQPTATGGPSGSHRVGHDTRRHARQGSTTARVSACRRSRTSQRAERLLGLDRLVPRQPADRTDYELVDLAERAILGDLRRASLQLEEPQVDGEAGAPDPR